MQDADCVRFLQQVLPSLHMRWPGFRRVRKQVCKRIARRLDELGLPDTDVYQDYLRANPTEWRALDALCRVTVTRFYRDRHVFGLLQQVYLPALASLLVAQGDSRLMVWSAGCASGEEPYTLSLLWAFALSAHFPELFLRVLATDANASLLRRAEEACYGYSSIKNLPEAWRERAFVQTDDLYCLRQELRTPVEFRRHDVRAIIPEGPFHLVLCRNLVFTYFDAGLQQDFLQRLQQAMLPGGILLLGVHERLPEAGHGFIPCSARWGIYRLGASVTDGTATAPKLRVSRPTD